VEGGYHRQFAVEVWPQIFAPAREPGVSGFQQP
jgi:hypothetical protein